ncbi:MAG: HAD hydrolase-like protein, partial [Acidobacteriota bacterium]|nr:HAD hydrolase-like protein [Acidobacteriota bacterium]
MKIARRDSLKLMAALTAQTGATATPPSPPRIRFVVLDTGGTIIEDRGDVPAALEAAFAKHGVKVRPEEIAQWRRASKREVVRHFAGEERTEAVYADFNARLIDAYRKVPPIAGAETAFERMRSAGLLLAATTGFDRQVTASIFERL